MQHTDFGMQSHDSHGWEQYIDGKEEMRVATLQVYASSHRSICFRHPRRTMAHVSFSDKPPLPTSNWRLDFVGLLNARNSANFSRRNFMVCSPSPGASASLNGTECGLFVSATSAIPIWAPSGSCQKLIKKYVIPFGLPVPTVDECGLVMWLSVKI